MKLFNCFFERKRESIARNKNTTGKTAQDILSMRLVGLLQVNSHFFFSVNLTISYIDFFSQYFDVKEEIQIYDFSL